MVFSNTILEEKDKKNIYNLFDFHVKVIKNENGIHSYFEQKFLK